MARRTTVVAVAAGAVAGALATGGVVAVASVPGPSGVISACVSSKGVVRIIDPARKQKCATRERAVAWQSLRVRGAWSPSAAYRGGDVVTRGGSSYLAKSASKGSVPGASAAWSVLAAAGAQGPAGAPGLAGAPGAPGAQGPAGVAGADATALWAAFSGAGVLARGSGVTAVTRQATGRYLVTFNRTVNGCSVTANAAANAPVLAARGMTRLLNGVGDVNFVSIAVNQVFVVTTTFAGADADLTSGNVHVQVFC